MPAPLRSLPPPSKKRKIQRVDHAQTIKKLEEELTTAVAKNSSLNPLADLLSLAYNVEDPHDTSKAIYALYRVFVVIITNNKLGLGGDEAAKVVKAWIWERLQSYADFLGSLLQDEEKFLRVSLTDLKIILASLITSPVFRPTNIVFVTQTSLYFSNELIYFQNSTTSVSHVPLPKDSLGSATLSCFQKEVR